MIQSVDYTGAGARRWAQLELDGLADRAAANKYTSPLDHARAQARVGDMSRRNF